MPARRGQRHAGTMDIIGEVNPAPRRTAWVVIVATALLLSSALVPLASATGSGQLRTIAAALQRFLLFYSGVFALIALTAAVGAGLAAADRVVMAPGPRIVTQATHRALSLLALATLFNHITLEIIAHRAHAGDAFVPFLAQRQVLFMGLGTIATDLFVLILVTGILRKRFAAGARPWVWRALHATAYLAWPLAILHGLVAGRTAKPYVDWSYGACLAAVGLALTMRRVAMVRSRHLSGRSTADQFSQRVRVPSAMAAPFGELGLPSVPAWTGPLGPLAPQRTAPRALAAPAEQPLMAQPGPGPGTPDGTPSADYLPRTGTFPGEGHWTGTFPGDGQWTGTFPGDGQWTGTRPSDGQWTSPSDSPWTGTSPSDSPWTGTSPSDSPWTGTNPDEENWTGTYPGGGN